MKGLILSDDLLFASRITAAAQAGGFRVDQVRDAHALIDRAMAENPSAIFIDLQHPGLDITALAVALEMTPTRPQLIAYGSHVAVDVLNAARAAGCDEVLPRSAFVQKLATDLPRWLGSA